MECTIVSQVKRVPLSHQAMRAVVQATLKQITKASVVLSIHVIGDTRMQRLNHQYRGKDKTTDVLSFSCREGTPFFVGITTEEEWGDIFISAAQIRRQAKTYAVSEKEEFARMLVHGVLHLAGYDHIKKSDEKIMIGLQEQIIQQLHL